jgi:uracil-DNA glycosylase
MGFQEFEKEVKKCIKCRLSQNRTNVVPGEGDYNTDIMLIGEGPGKNEDEQGRPFVGAAGKLLDQMIESIGLKRENVYIANVVKCRPPNNRDPLPDEVEACWSWLEQQIKIIKPKVIVTLGRHSLARFLPSARISKDHGRALRKKFLEVGRIVFFPSYHPAAALYNGGLRETLFQDFKKIPKVLEIIEGDQEKEAKERRENVEKGINKKQKQARLF